MPDHVGKDVADILMARLHHLMVGAKMPGHAALMLAFIEGGVSEGYGKRVNAPGSEAANQRRDDRGIQPAAKISADRHVGEEAKAGRVRKKFPQLFERFRLGIEESLEILALSNRRRPAANSV